MTRPRWLLLGVAALLAALVGLLVIRGAPSGPAPSDIGGPFKLIDQTGAPVDQRLLRGRWSAVFFGYTYCPDVCPTTLAALGQAVDALGPAADRFQVVFVTVDPQRDTPAALRAYLSSPAFPKGARGLTGPPDQVAAAARTYHVYVRKVGQGDGYTVDHSSVVYLMDPQGRFVRPLDPRASPSDLARQIRAAMGQG